jgi:hypothetical protein
VQQNRGPDVRTIVVSPEPADHIGKLMAEQGLSVDHVYQVPFASVGVLGTPTVFLVDSRGVVRDVIFGLMDAAKQDRFLKELADARC